MAAAQGIRAGRAYVELGVADKLTGGLKKAQARLQAFGAGVKSLGTKLTGAAVVAGLPVAGAMKVFATFEQSMARVRALTGASAADFQRLSSTAKRMGETTVFTAGQAADAMSFFALAGFKVDQILTAIGPTLNLAAAGQLEIAQAADIAAKIMAGMGIEADKLGYAVDVLTKAMTTANTDLSQLGDAMKFVGPIAKSAGTAFEEIVAAIQLLSNAGIQGEMAGTTLRGAILSLTSPSQEAAKQLKDLGVQVKDARGNVRPLADIIDDLNRGMAGMGSGERLERLGQIFNARQAAGVAELLSQGADKLRDYTAALRDSGGVASRIAGVQLDTLQGDATILRSAIEGLAIAVGETLVKALRGVIQPVTKVVGAVAQWVRENQQLVTGLALGIVAVGAAGATLIGLGVAAQAAGFVLGGLASVLATVKVALVATVSMFGALLSPIGLVVVAVAGLSAAVLVHTGAAGKALGWLKERFGELGTWVKTVLDGITKALQRGDIELATRVLWAALRVAWYQGTTALREAWEGLKSKCLSIVDDFVYGSQSAWVLFVTKTKEYWTKLTAGLRTIWTEFTSWHRSTVEDLGAWFARQWLKIQAKFDPTLNLQFALESVDQQQAQAKADIERERVAKLEEIAADRQKDLDEIEADRQRRLLEIGEKDLAAQEARNAAQAERLRKLQEELANAKAELAAALAQVREEAPGGAESGTGGTSGAAPGRPVRRYRRGWPGDPAYNAQRAAQGLAEKLSIVGTFNPNVLRALVPGGSHVAVAERTARGVEQTRDEVKGLREDNRRNPQRFT